MAMVGPESSEEARKNDRHSAISSPSAGVWGRPPRFQVLRGLLKSLASVTTSATGDDNHVCLNGLNAQDSQAPPHTSILPLRTPHLDQPSTASSILCFPVLRIYALGGEVAMLNLQVLEFSGFLPYTLAFVPGKN